MYIIIKKYYRIIIQLIFIYLNLTHGVHDEMISSPLQSAYSRTVVELYTFSHRSNPVRRWTPVLKQ